MICGSMGRSLLDHPRPLRRKTSELDGYYKNGIPITSAMIGDTVTWDVPGHSPGTVYLVQNVNGQPGYMGPIAVPMAPFLLTPAQQTGLWSNTVYDKQGGNVIEADSLTILAQQTNQNVKPPTGIQCPDGYTYYASYTDQNGNVQPPGCMVTPQKTGTTTTPTATGGGSGGGSSSTTTTTSTTTSSGGTTPTAAAPPNDTLLLVAVAALAFLMLK